LKNSSVKNNTLNNKIEAFNYQGYCKLKLFTLSEFQELRNFGLLWLKNLLGEFPLTEDINNYHLWFNKLENDHDKKLTAKNRHTLPPKYIGDILLSSIASSQIIQSVVGDYEVWNEGIGWLGIRVIRPKPYADGYDLSKKTWGPGGRLFSIYIPLFQADKNSSIGVIKSSHLNSSFTASLDTSQKFCKDELRLNKSEFKSLEIERFDYKDGECLLTHPELIHCEKVSPLAVFSRISLEVRLKQKQIS
jgi:hypothetical protein